MPRPILWSPETNCVAQLDGNISLLSDHDEDDNYPEKYQIPVVMHVSQSLPLAETPVWFDKYEKYHRGPQFLNNITIKRNNRLIRAEILPKISVSNMRSLSPKINNFKTDVLEREISIALLSEVWEKAKSKKHQFQFEKMFQISGLKYI